MAREDRPLIEALGIGERELVALVGGGGKTSLLFALADELAAAGRGVVLTTTTRIATAEVQRVPTVYLTHHLPGQRSTRLKTPCLVIGATGPEKAKSVPLELPRRLLARPEVDAVLVEADGAKMLPVKAPATHEPAVPPGTTLFVVLMGIDALDGPLHTVAHRPHLVGALTGRAQSERLRPADAATLLTHPRGGLKRAPPGARVVIFINKVETAAQMEKAIQIADQIAVHPRIERVVLGALQTGRPVRTVFAKAGIETPSHHRPAGAENE